MTSTHCLVTSPQFIFSSHTCFKKDRDNAALPLGLDSKGIVLAFTTSVVFIFIVNVAFLLYFILFGPGKSHNGGSQL